MNRMLLASVLIAAGCISAGSGDVDQDSTAEVRGQQLVAPETAVPSQFGFGLVASEGRIAWWDIDVKPDGEGLPPGSGTVAEGEQVYVAYCTACHGPTGTEGPNDRLVSTAPWGDDGNPPSPRTIGNYWPYATTVFDFVRRAMPQLTPGILTDDQVYAVTGYLLYLNEIVPEDAVMNAETLPAVLMPARDRFVDDDRVGGSGPIR